MAYFATKHKQAAPNGKAVTIEQVVVASTFVNATLVINEDVEAASDSGVLLKVEEKYWAEVAQEQDSPENPFWEVKVEVESVDKDYTETYLIQGETSAIVSDIALNKVEGSGRITACKETKIKAIIHEQQD